MAMTPVGASASEQYFFRYKTPLLASVPAQPPIDETEYGIGNDIVAYYVAPVGYEFTKKIPVATQDVIEWRKDSTTDDVPEGILLDASKGIFDGAPAAESLTTTLFHGYDAAGNRIARAEIHFTVFEPVGVPSKVDFYAHTGTYFYGEVPAPDAVTVHTWSPITTYADGMSMMNAAFQGTPTKAGTYGLAWRGFDYLGREVAFAYGDFLVEDGPVVEELADGEIRRLFGDQIADKSRGESFHIQPTVRRALGSVTYKLIPESTRPDGITFASSSGSLGGVYDDFEATASFSIEARDSYDGTTGRSNVFSLATLPAELDISALPNLSGTVGHVYRRSLRAANIVAGARWELLEGALPEGVSLDPDSGTLTGTPTKVETASDIVVGVSGAGMVATRSNPFSFRIYAEPLEASTAPLHVRVNSPFQTKGVSVTRGADGGYAVLDRGTLPEGVSLAPDTGILSSPTGFPTAGVYDTALTVDNGRRLGLWQVMRAYNPLKLAYQNLEVARYEWLSVYPQIADSSAIGHARYSIIDTDGDTLPDWMTFSPTSGRIYGTPTKPESADVTYGPFVVTLADEQDTASSDPFTIKVEERPAIELTVNDQDVERFVGNGYRIASQKNGRSGVTYKALSLPANWPSTLRITSDGWLSGRTEDPVGTVYQGIVLNVVDGEGFQKTSDPFDLTVVEPENLGGLYGNLDKTVEWTIGMPLSGSLPPIRNGYGNITYAFQGDAGGLSITDAATGSFSGTPAAEGAHAIGFTIGDDTDRDPAQGTLTLKINAKPEAKADPTYDVSRAGRVDLTAPSVTGGTNPLVYKLQGVLPRGMSFSNGRLYGIPEEVGSFPVSVTVSDKSTASSTAAFSIEVGQPLPFAISYPPTTLYYGKSGSAGVLLSPKTENAMPSAASITWAAAAGTLPGGVSFATTGPYAGRFVGTPAQTGRFSGIVVTATDGEGRKASTTVDLVVTRDGEVGFSDRTFKHRKGITFTDTLSATNVVDPVAWSSADPSGIGYGLILNGSSGTITGSFAELGSYPVAITATDDMGRSTTATVTFEVVGDLSVSAADVAFKQYETAQGTPATASNVVGTVTYALKSGRLPAGLSIDPASGAVVGVTEETGVFAGIAVEGTDSDGSAAVSDPFTITVEMRAPIALEAPAMLSLKRFSEASFAARVADAIPPVRYDVTPDLPAGLTLDHDTGAINGSPDDIVAQTVYTLTATDSKGGELGTDVVQFTLSVDERDPLGIDGGESYEFPQYFAGAVVYAPINPIGSPKFAISPALPDGLALDEATGRISGTSTAKYGPTQHVLTLADDHDTISKTITLSVGDRTPLEFVTAEAQSVMLGHELSLPLEVRNVVGDELTWEHVGGTLPEGLTFDAASGTFSGTPSEFGVVSTVTIRATDAFGGSADRTFSFNVLQDGTPITLTAEGATTRVGEAFSIPAPQADNVVGETVWTADLGTTGLVINPKTGELAGTPSFVFSTDVTLTVSDSTGRTSTQAVTVVSVPRISVSAPPVIDLTFNRDPAPEARVTATDAVGETTWTVSGTLPQGVSLDTATGALVGRPEQIGTFGPVFVTAADSLPGTTTSNGIMINVAMNDDPIELAVSDFVTKVGYPVQTAVPTYENNLGPVTFFSSDLGGIGLVIDSNSGVLTGTAQAVADQFINVSIRDRDTTRVTSRPLRYQVLPNMQITLPAQVTLSALTDIVPVAPTRSYVVGASTWEPLDESLNKLPEGIVFDTASGTFSGNAKEIGTFGPFTVSSTDALGDRGISNSFVIKVNPGAYFIGLAAAPQLPDGVKRVEEYSYDFKQHMTIVGMDESELDWELGAGSPPGLSIENGIMSGTPSLSGTYTFDVTASYENISATRSYTVEIKLPEAGLELASSELPQAKRRVATADNTYSFDFKSLMTPTLVDAAAVVYTVEPFAAGEALPTGLSLANGVLAGIADHEPGTFSFRITASFTDSTDENITVTTAYSLDLIDEIGFEFNAAPLSPATKRTAYSFGLHGLIDTASLEGVSTDDLSWSWEADVAKNPAAVLPPGLSISGSEITGIPTNSGDFDVVVTASYDGRSKSKAFSLVSGLPPIAMNLTGAELEQIVRGVSLDIDLGDHLSATNIPLTAIAWSIEAPAQLQPGEIAGLPAGLKLAAGRLSGAPTALGIFRFKVKTDWSDTNPVAETASSEAEFTVEVVGAGKNYVDVSVARDHSCGVLATGTVNCWGLNSTGQLGNGTTNTAKTPTTVLDLTSATQVATGSQHSCALQNSGAVKCWGARGLLGDGSTSGTSTRAVTVSGPQDYASITAGESFTCGMTRAGGVRCWGLNATGQIGDGSNANATTPVEVSGLGSGVLSISAGNNHTCVVMQDRSVRCWGDNKTGQLGDGTRTNSTSPVAATVVAGRQVTEVSGGGFHTCVVDEQGAMACWGMNQQGQMGDGTTTSVVLTAVTPSGLTGGVRRPRAGYYYTCAVMESGSAKCWGQNGVGRLGTGKYDSVTTPADVVNLQGIIAFDAVYAHACAVVPGDLRCWGQNGTYRLGNGTTVDTHTPTSIAE